MCHVIDWRRRPSWLNSHANQLPSAHSWRHHPERTVEIYCHGTCFHSVDSMSPACEMLLDETPLFDPALLKELDWSANTVPFSPPISPTDPGEGLVLRPLCAADFKRGFYKVLSQLTVAGDVTPEQFIENFEHMKNTGDYYVVVVEDTNLGQIVATATLIVEHKFIRGCARRGRVEEVVVSDVCRGKQLGKLLVSALTLLSKKLDCYKITLECAPNNVAFYKKFGYSASTEIYMQCRFQE